MVLFSLRILLIISISFIFLLLKFLTEQKELLKIINGSITQNNTGIGASLVKLDFLTQMTFGSLPASMQLEYLKNSDHLIPLSTTEKYK